MEPLKRTLVEGRKRGDGTPRSDRETPEAERGLAVYPASVHRWCIDCLFMLCYLLGYGVGSSQWRRLSLPRSSVKRPASLPVFMKPGDSTGTGAGDVNPRATKPPNDGDGQCVFASFWGIGQKDVAACDKEAAALLLIWRTCVAELFCAHAARAPLFFRAKKRGKTRQGGHPPFFSFVLMEYTSGDFTKARQYRWGSSLRPTR